MYKTLFHSKEIFEITTKSIEGLLHLLKIVKILLDEINIKILSLSSNSIYSIY